MIRHMKQHSVIAGLLVVTALSTFASAQRMTNDQEAVRQKVEEFLAKLGNRDVAGVRATMTPKALMVVVRQREGAFVNSIQTGDEWLAQLEKNPNAPKFEEPLTNVQVTVDSGHLGYLRADFTVVRDGKVMSSGVDQFTLVKDADGWKIVAAAYTSLPAPTPTR
jgi:ketosteroid isomerase-like protein